MSSFLVDLAWFLLFFGGGIYLAYHRINLLTSTIVAGAALIVYTVYGSWSFITLILLWLLFAVLFVPNMPEFRRERITRPALEIYRKLLPSMSDTEREALEAGNVWWDGELFSGMPHWDRLTKCPAFANGKCKLVRKSLTLQQLPLSGRGCLAV